MDHPALRLDGILDSQALVALTTAQHLSVFVPHFRSVPQKIVTLPVSCENANLYHAISKYIFSGHGRKLFTFHVAVNNAERTGAYELRLPDARAKFHPCQRMPQIVRFPYRS